MKPCTRCHGRHAGPCNDERKQLKRAVDGYVAGARQRLATKVRSLTPEEIAAYEAELKARPSFKTGVPSHRPDPVKPWRWKR